MRSADASPLDFVKVERVAALGELDTPMQGRPSSE